jgi:hypothetical protein
VWARRLGPPALRNWRACDPSLQGILTPRKAPTAGKGANRGYWPPEARMRGSTRSYVVTTGVIFLAIAVAHVLRMVFESARLATEPGYLALTLVAVALALWAGWLARPGARL